MRIGLISARGETARLRIAGASLAFRQGEYLMAQGVETIICIADASTGLDPDLTSLQHRVEKAGGVFHIIRDAHRLIPLIAAGDRLAVIAEGLLPDHPLPSTDERAIYIIGSVASKGPSFEVIDAETLWTGLAVLPGALVSRLGDLPPDSDPIPSLLRVGLQNSVPQRELTVSDEAVGGWQVLDDTSANRRTSAWLDARLDTAGTWSPSRILGRWVSRRLWPAMQARRINPRDLFSLSLLVALTGLGTTVAGYAIAALCLAVVAVLLAEFASASSALAEYKAGRVIPLAIGACIAGICIGASIAALLGTGAPPYMAIGLPVMAWLSTRVTSAVLPAKLGDLIADGSVLAVTLVAAIAGGVLQAVIVGIVVVTLLAALAAQHTARR